MAQVLRLSGVPAGWEDMYGWYYYANQVRNYDSAAIPKGNPSYRKSAATWFAVKHCDTCERQWQPLYNRRDNGLRCDYYKGLPTYGLKKEECLKCAHRRERFYDTKSETNKQECL